MEYACMAAEIVSDSVCFWGNWFHLLLHCCHFCQDAFEVASKFRESLWCLLCEKGGNTGLKWPDISRSIKLAVQVSHLIREGDFGGIFCRASAIVWHSVTNYTMFCDSLWRYDIIWLIWYDIISYHMIWRDRYNMLDMIWYDMTWYDMIWYDMICCTVFAAICCCCFGSLVLCLLSLFPMQTTGQYVSFHHPSAWPWMTAIMFPFKAWWIWRISEAFRGILHDFAWFCHWTFALQLSFIDLI